MPASALNPSALYWSLWGSGHVELLIPGAAVQAIASSGSNDAAVKEWAPRIPRPTKATPAAVRAALLDIGGWTEEDLQDDATNWQRAIWCAAWNIADDEEPDCSEPIEGLAGYLGLAPVPNALGRIRALRDPATGDTLRAYAPGDGSLSLLWRRDDRNPSGRRVTEPEARALLEASQQDPEGLHGWRVNTSEAGPRLVKGG